MPSKKKEEHHHPHEGAASAEFRHMTESQIEKEDKQPHPKHLWEGKDLWLPKDGSYWYCMNRPVWLNSLLVLFMICLGAVEGFLFVKVSIINPIAIVEQFRFKMWIVMKIFLMVVGSSMFVQSIFDYVSPSFYNETRAVRYIKNGFIKAALGGAFIGFGRLHGGHCF